MKATRHVLRAALSFAPGDHRGPSADRMQRSGTDSGSDAAGSNSTARSAGRHPQHQLQRADGGLDRQREPRAVGR